MDVNATLQDSILPLGWARSSSEKHSITYLPHTISPHIRVLSTKDNGGFSYTNLIYRLKGPLFQF